MMSNPKIPEIKPLMVDSLETLAIAVKPNIANIVYSGGPNFKATLAKRGATVIKTRTLTIPPKTDAVVARAMAFPVSPFWLMGYPSSTVAAAAGVPGIPKVIEVIAPPYTPPINSPSSEIMPVSAGKEKEKGIKITMAIKGPKPGIIPAIIPKKTETAITIIFCAFRAILKAGSIDSTVFSLTGFSPT